MGRGFFIQRQDKKQQAQNKENSYERNIKQKITTQYML